MKKILSLMMLLVASGCADDAAPRATRAPLVQLDGVRPYKSDDAPWTKTFFAVSGDSSWLRLRITNVGAGDAVYPKVFVEGPICLVGAPLLEGNGIAQFGILGPNESAETVLTFKPELGSCSDNPVELKVTIEAPGQIPARVVDRISITVGPAVKR